MNENEDEEQELIEFMVELQILKDAIIGHNEKKKWWQPKWKLNEGSLLFSICYSGFPNPLKIQKTWWGWSWLVFPEEYDALMKPDKLVVDVVP